MVVLELAYGAVDVWIKCAGHNLEVHNLKSTNSGSPTLECFIASQMDKVCGNDSFADYHIPLTLPASPFRSCIDHYNPGAPILSFAAF
jgi:hypothetical protein